MTHIRSRSGGTEINVTADAGRSLINDMDALIGGIGRMFEAAKQRDPGAQKRLNSILASLRRDGFA